MLTGKKSLNIHSLVLLLFLISRSKGVQKASVAAVLYQEIQQNEASLHTA